MLAASIAFDNTIVLMFRPNCNKYFVIFLSDGFSFTPQEFNLDLYLRPFIPNYLPASGDVDIMIKVSISLPSLSVTGHGGPLSSSLLNRHYIGLQSE